MEEKKKPEHDQLPFSVLLRFRRSSKPPGLSRTYIYSTASTRSLRTVASPIVITVVSSSPSLPVSQTSEAAGTLQHTVLSSEYNRLYCAALYPYQKLASVTVGSNVIVHANYQYATRTCN
jgi:hypothetical protein